MRREPGAGTWLLAGLLTLLLHVAVVGGIYAGRPPSPPPPPVPDPAPIEFVFAPKAAPPAPARDAGQPREFTELPPDRKDQAPEHADLLSNVTSRARQESPSDRDTGLPRMTGASDFPHVALSPGGGPAQPKQPSPAQANPAQTPPREQPPSPDRTAGSPEEPKAPADPSEAVKDGSKPAERIPGKPAFEPNPAPPKPAPDESPLIRKFDPDHPAALDPDKARLLSPFANYDILQDAMQNPGGGAPLPGGISLNTLEWPYAPWLQQFTRDFLARWTAPYAYRMGMIHGSQVLELEIAPDGKLLRMDLLAEEGDSVLVTTSELTFRAMAPFHPLPSDFPEKTLILRIKLVYPDLRREYEQLQERRREQEPERPRRGGRRP